MTQTHPWQAAPEIIAAQRRSRNALLVAQIAGSIGIGAGAAMGSIIAYEVTGTESLAGISRTVSALSAGLAAPLMIALAMRSGRRTALAWGWTGALIGSLIQVAAVAALSLPLLLVGLLIYGSGQAATLQSRFAATDLELPERRGRSLSLVVWAGAAGAVIGPNLAGPGAALGTLLGLSPISGAYLIGAVGLAAAAAAIFLGLRPDPLQLAQQNEALSVANERRRLRDVLPYVGSHRVTRYAFVGLAVNQTIMVTVMSLTPVHLVNHGHSLTLVGFTISLHSLGMFGFSPIPGWLSDRWGRSQTMLVGWGINLAALLCGLVGAGSVPVVMFGLFLLGLGWSFVMVSGSALLNESAAPEWRRPVQGAVDSVTQLGAAIGAGAAGLLLAWLGFPGLNAVSMLLLVPVAVLAIAARGRTAVEGA